VTIQKKGALEGAPYGYFAGHPFMVPSR